MLSTWREELGAFEGTDIKLAIDACRFAYKEFPPTLYQFADLCRDAMRRRTQATPRLEGGRGHGPVDAEIIAEIHRLTHELGKPKTGPQRDWARRILKRADAGEPMPLIAVQSAKEALSLA
jgi:hypothetical protein